ncbi:MAG TPA: aldehyde dehydrogenase family protein [Azospira sp.]|nr:aldehyde dehydrogenase family protein [Azospira sp.]
MMLTPTDAPALPLWIGGRAYLTMAPAFRDLQAADGQVLRRVPLCGADEVAVAVDGARLTLATWSAADVESRRGCVAAVADGLERYTGHFAKLLMEETGRDEAAAQAEVAATIAGLRALPAPHVAPRLVAAITDNRAPLLAPALLAGAALAAGAVVVLKPSPLAPSCALAVAELFTRGGLPDGACNLVQGDEAAVAGLCVHPRVDVLAFAGDAATAAKVQTLAGQRPLLALAPEASLAPTLLAALQG